MTLTVHHGIEDALAPPRPPRTPPRAPDLCPEARVIDVQAGVIAHCQKRRHHDDPFAEIGGGRTDPYHQDRHEIDGVTITYTWRTT